MSVQTQARNVVGTAVTILVVLAAYAIWGQGVGKPAREDTEEHIFLEVTFSPPSRIGGIQIVATVEGVKICCEEPVQQSPWTEVTWVPRGAKVSLRAWQESFGELRGTIRPRGKQAITNETDQTPGQIACVYKSPV